MKSLKLFAVVALMSVAGACGQPAATNSNAPANANKPANANANANKPANTNAAANSNATANKNTAKVEVPPTATTETGQVFSDPDVGLSLEAPKGWKGEGAGDSLTITSPDGGIAVVFLNSDAASVDAAVSAMAAKLDEIMSGVTMTGPVHEGKINDIPSMSASGSGTLDDGGKAVDFQLDVIQAKKPVIILFMAEKGSIEKNAAELEKLEKSIKKI